MDDLSGRKYVTEAAKRNEPGCPGKHFIPGYLVLGETCGYCKWTKVPVSAKALKAAREQAKRQRIERLQESIARDVKELSRLVA